MTVSLQEAVDRLCDVEERRGLLGHEVDGWSAWPIVRFELSLHMAGLSFPHSRPVGRAGRLRLALGDLPSLMTLRRARHLVKTYTSGLVERADGRFRDIWFDDVIEALGSVFKIEVANSQTFAARGRLALVRRDLSGAAVDMASALLARRAPGAGVRSASAAFGSAIREDLGLPDIEDAWVARRLERFSAARRVYRSIVRRTGASVVLIADPGEHALIAGGREQGAQVVELQHGVADSSNASYRWTGAARPYRARMPVPDRLLLYGDHWRAELDRFGFWGDSLRVVGSPRLDRYRAESGRRIRDRCEMLFTTQGLDVDAAARFLRDALERLGSEAPFHLSVKLHPIYDTDPRPYRRALEAFGDRVAVLGGDEGASTFELFQRANLHLSIASASHYDALGLGVPTVVLPFRTHEVVLPLVRAGHARSVQTPEDLAGLVRTWQNLTVPAAVREYYFRPGGLANILHELGREPFPA